METKRDQTTGSWLVSFAIISTCFGATIASTRGYLPHAIVEPCAAISFVAFARWWAIPAIPLAYCTWMAQHTAGSPFFGDHADWIVRSVFALPLTVWVYIFLATVYFFFQAEAQRNEGADSHD